MNPVMFTQDRNRSPMMRAALALLGKQKPIRHLSDGIANAANSVAGALLTNKAGERQKAEKEAFHNTMAKALSAGAPQTAQGPMPNGSAGYTVPGSQDAMIKALMGNEQTAPIALNMKLSDVQAESDKIGTTREKTIMQDGVPHVVPETYQGNGLWEVSGDAIPQWKPSDRSGGGTAPIDNYNHRLQLVSQFGEDSPQVRQFDLYVRAPKYLDLGDRYAQPNPANPTVPVAEYPKGIGPERDIVGGQVVTMPAVPGGPGAAPSQGSIPVNQGASTVPDNQGGIQSTSLPQEAEDKRKEAITARRKILSQVERLPSLRNTVQELKGLADSWFTGGLTGQILQNSAGSDQYAMNAKVDEIKGLVGLDNLVSIKEQGGTFGALDRNELNLLIARAGTLDPLLESFPEDVDEVLGLYEKGLAGRISDFQSRNAGDAEPLFDGENGKIIQTLGIKMPTPDNSAIPVGATPTREEILQEIERRKRVGAMPDPSAAANARGDIR